MTGEVDVINIDNNATHHFTGATSSVPLTVTGPGSLSVTATAVAGAIGSATSTPTTESRNGIPIVPAWGDPVPKLLGQNTYQGLPGSGSSSSSPGNLAAYSGAGYVLLSFNAAAGGGTYGGTEVGGSGHLFFGGNAAAGGDVKITYTYHQEQQAIPEPETLFLVGSALIGVSVMFQRKRRKARS
jgi:hypothetical protein